MRIEVIIADLRSIASSAIGCGGYADESGVASTIAARIGLCRLLGSSTRNPVSYTHLPLPTIYSV